MRIYSILNDFRIIYFGGEVSWNIKMFFLLLFLGAFVLGFLLWYAGGSWEEFYRGFPDCSNYWLSYIMR